MQVADRYHRIGGVNVFCPLMVAIGMTFAPCFLKRCFADFETFLLALFAS
jgi:hypothetical protein